ncbi:hypothetical protein ACJ41O_006420 [Fusarium nematophilum]
MGGWDAYCAICGVVTTEIYWPEEGEEEEEYTYDPSIISREDSKWITHVRLLTQDVDSGKYGNLTMPVANQNLQTECLCRSIHFTPPATFWDYGAFNYPKEDGECTHMTYGMDSDLSAAFPVHDACADQLARVLAPETLDLETLYETFKLCSHGSDSTSFLNLDYDGVEACMDQYWLVMRGTEDYVTSPSPSPQQLEWYRAVVDHLPERLDKTPAIVDGYNPQNDPFCKLQPELLLHVMSYMTMTESTRWREASRPVASLPVMNSFWKSKIHADMPWLYDFSEPKDKPVALVDWEALYKALYRAAYTGSIHKQEKLTSRRRIWKVCSQILKVYRQELESKEKQKQMGT